MQTIKLSLLDGTWHAAFYENGISDPEIMALFGTTMIPTPFTGAMPADVVLRCVREKNPDAMVKMSIELGAV